MTSNSGERQSLLKGHKLKNRSAYKVLGEYRVPEGQPSQKVQMALYMKSSKKLAEKSVVVVIDSFKGEKFEPMASKGFFWSDDLKGYYRYWKAQTDSLMILPDVTNDNGQGIRFHVYEWVKGAGDSVVESQFLRVDSHADVLRLTPAGEVGKA